MVHVLQILANVKLFHTVTMPKCHTALLPHCHTATLPYWLPHYHNATLSLWHLQSKVCWKKSEAEQRRSWWEYASVPAGPAALSLIYWASITAALGPANKARHARLAEASWPSYYGHCGLCTGNLWQQLATTDNNRLSKYPKFYKSMISKKLGTGFLGS